MKISNAIAYLRTSSAANIGVDKASGDRQREAIKRCAKDRGFSILSEHYDEAVSGADAPDTRPGFKALLAEVERTGVRTIIIEDPSRFARTMRAAVLGEILLEARGVQVICANGEPLFDAEDDERQLFQRIQMAFSEHEKRKIVRRLRDGRDRASARQGRRVEGLARQYSDEVLSAAKRLYRKPRKGQRRSLRAIAIELSKLGYTAPSGDPYQPNSVRQILIKAGTYQGAAQ